MNHTHKCMLRHTPPLNYKKTQETTGVIKLAPPTSQPLTLHEFLSNYLFSKHYTMKTAELRDLPSFGAGLTDEQIIEKKKMLKESAEIYPHIAEYFRELCVDFCVRFPEEATRQRETKEWESLETRFTLEKMLDNSNHESHNT